MTSIETLMRDSNPMMDPSTEFSEEEIQAFDLLVRTRSGNVDVQELTKPVEPEKKQRSGWLVAAAAFAVVIVFVGAAMLLASPADELPPATTPPTTEALTPTTQAVVEESAPTTVAASVVSEDALSPQQQEFVDAFIAAFNAGTYETYPGDYEEFLGYFAKDALINTSIVVDAGVDRFREGLAFRGAMNYEFEVTTCREEYGAIRCKINVSSDGISHYQDPVPTEMSLIVKNARVSSMTWIEPMGPVAAATTPFYEWVASNHPGKLSLMRIDNGVPGTPRTTEESIDLWLELLPQYKATLDG